ncbi:rRNA adenine N-6-methyltransferase family protein [Nocardia vulneris]|uniref:ribosomal RNA small subunit methyltransferase A n=1 Tax=Nocardia vulneris TaxID=1141657 RepID=UPI0030D37FC3
MAQDFAYRNYSHTQGKVKNGGGGRPSKGPARQAHSQNSLVSQEAVASILAVAEPRGTVLEPHPGDGLLTQALARCGAQVTAYEPDPLSAAKLSARTRAVSGIRVVRADFTKAKPLREPFAVVGNLPLAATARIIDWCLAAPTLTSATLVVPQEYAHVGQNGHWDPVTSTNWPWFDWQLHGPLARTDFRPPHTTDTAILHIHRRTKPLVHNQDSYATLVHTGFANANVPLPTALRPRYPDVDEALHVTGIAPDTPAAAVHPADWVRLHKHLNP